MSTMTSTAAPLTDNRQLTATEKDLATSYVRQTVAGVTGAIQGLSRDQWNFSPRDGAWSPGFIVEHLTFVWERVLGPVREQLLSTPEVTGSTDCATVDSIVIHQFPNRLNRFETPPFALPAGRLPSSEEAFAILRTIPGRAQDYLRTPDLRKHALEAMPLKLVTKGEYSMLDGYQWLLAATAHAERHTKQILEVRADAGFPGR